MNYSFFLLLLNSYFIISLQLKAKNNDIEEKCDTCKTLVGKFTQELERTKKGNFGGGNTDWEDRKLGKYLTSETRFEEIVENLCSKKDYECYKLFESQEDLLLYKFQNDHIQLEIFLNEEFCVNVLELCCPKETFGPKCVPCNNTKWNKICSGNGQCNGNGTRTGSGACMCNLGYRGSFCDKCANMYYVKAETEKSIQCEACELPCISCTSKTKCLTCQSGYSFNNKDQSCKDIDECEENEDKCGAENKCINTPGSFECRVESGENNENESGKKNKKTMQTLKKTFVIGISVFCTTSALITRNYLMAIVSASLGFVIDYLAL